MVSRRSSPASEARSASRTAGSVAISSRNVLARQDDRLGRDERGRARRARRAVEQRDLAEDVAGPERRQDRLVAGLGRQRDLDLARHDDEQRVARIAGVEDDLAAPEAARPRPGRDPLEGGRVEPGEERDPGK